MIPILNASQRHRAAGSSRAGAGSWSRLRDTAKGVASEACEVTRVGSTSTVNAVPGAEALSTTVINVGFGFCSLGLRVMSLGALLWIGSVCFRAALRSVGLSSVPQIRDNDPDIIDVTWTESRA